MSEDVATAIAPGDVVDPETVDPADASFSDDELEEAVAELRSASRWHKIKRVDKLAVWLQLARGRPTDEVRKEFGIGLSTLHAWVRDEGWQINMNDAGRRALSRRVAAMGMVRINHGEDVDRDELARWIEWSSVRTRTAPAPKWQAASIVASPPTWPTPTGPTSTVAPERLSIKHIQDIPDDFPNDFPDADLKREIRDDFRRRLEAIIARVEAGEDDPEEADEAGEAQAGGGEVPGEVAGERGGDSVPGAGGDGVGGVGAADTTPA